MIVAGDCLEIMATLPAASVDAIVTDPPAGIGFMGKEWDDFRRKRNPNDAGRDSVFGRTSRTGPEYGRRSLDAFAEFIEAVGREFYRLLKPGHYAVVWALPKTSFATGWGLYKAGLEPREGVAHIFASGFPKGKANLKPAWEHWLVFRKPGPIVHYNIDGCRIGIGSGGDRDGEASAERRYADRGGTSLAPLPGPRGGASNGRWPANVILTDPIFDGDVDGVVGGGIARTSGEYERQVFGARQGPASIPLDARESPQYADSGTYSRFFLLPKADRSDREPVIGRDGKVRRNTHPTVKSTELMAHLIKLVTPPGGTVLDPFLGSGSTAIAAERLGVKWIGIEKEPEYVAIAEARLNGVQRGLGLDVPAPTKKRTLPSDAKLADLAKTYPRRGWMPDLRGDKPEEAA